MLSQNHEDRDRHRQRKKKDIYFCGSSWYNCLLSKCFLDGFMAASGIAAFRMTTSRMVVSRMTACKKAANWMAAF